MSMKKLMKNSVLNKLLYIIVKLEAINPTEAIVLIISKLNYSRINTPVTYGRTDIITVYISCILNHHNLFSLFMIPSFQSFLYRYQYYIPPDRNMEHVQYITLINTIIENHHNYHNKMILLYEKNETIIGIFTLSTTNNIDISSYKTHPNPNNLNPLIPTILGY